LKSFFKNKFVSNILIVIISLGVILSVFPIDIPFFKEIQEFVPLLIFLYLFLGIFFLFLSNSRLLLVSFLAAGLLSLFLKTFSNENMDFSRNEGDISLAVSNYNLINLESDIQTFLADLQSAQSDVLCFHEVDFGWAKVLGRALEYKFPYQSTLVRLDGFGKMVCSSVPIQKVDTLYFNGIPTLDVQLDLEGKFVDLIVTQIVPPYILYQGVSSRAQLANLSQYINQSKHPVILAGEFNQVYWSKEMRNLVDETRLLNSRRFVATLGSKVPHEHIFHTDDFICIQTEEIRDSSDAHLGIKALLTHDKKGVGALSTSFGR
jgi:endonuclease/exonuclease/phosphatase (EEP) superfamily protein YafD